MQGDKYVRRSKYKNIFDNLIKVTIQIGQRKFLSLKTLKILYHGHM